MAVTDNCIQYDIRFFDEFAHYIHGLGPVRRRIIKWSVNRGWFQRETFMEDVLSSISGIDRDSTIGRDLANGDDVKTTTSQARNNNKERRQWTHSIPITNLKAKTGDLIVIAYNKILNQFHYFRIPYDAYRGRNKIDITIESYTSTIEPNFTGIPRTHKKSGDWNAWWEYEVDRIEDLFV